MHNDVFRTLDRLERLADDVLARLREHLHRHVVRNQVVFDQRAQKRVFRFARRGEAHFDLLKADL